MKKFLALVLIVLLQLVFIPVPVVHAATTTVNLLTADPFAILAGSAIVDANVSVVSGNVGLSPASGSFNALPCAEVTGTIYSVDGAGPLPCRVTNAGLLTTAKNDLTTAFTDAGGRTGATVLAGGDNQLGGKVLTDGVYSFSHATTANLIGTLTLNGQGDPNSVFIFQAASDFITASASVITLTNGAQACNVFWQVPTSATFGTGSNFTGTVLADQSITDNGGSTINGRFLARIAAVTLDNTHLSKPTCTTPTPTPVGSSSSSSSSTSNGATLCTSQGINTIPSIIEARRVSPTSIFVSWGPYAGFNNFVVEYGLSNNNWQFNTTVSGFSTTINDLPAGQAVWFRVAATDNCAVGTYGPAMLVGGTSGNTSIPGLPNTGVEPDSVNIHWKIVAPIGILLLALAIL